MAESTRTEAFVAACYRRLGRWYLHTLLFATFVFVVVVNLPVENISQVPLWTDGGLSEWWYALVFVLPSFIVGPIALIGVIGTRHRALFAAQRGEPVDPVELWHSAVTKVPLTSQLVTLPWGIAIAIPGIFWIGQREQFTVSAHLAMLAGQILLMLGTGAFYFMVYELACLPFARQAASQLPTGFTYETGLNVRRRLLLMTTGITFTIGCEASGFAAAFDRDVRLWAVALTTIGLVATYVGVPLALVSFNVTRRVKELANAMQAVGHGPTTVRVHPSNGDEFDTVVRALNQTVDILDEHAFGLQQSRARLVAVADETRRRAERDLHDGAQQHLAIVSMKLGMLARRAADRPDVVDEIGHMRADLAESLEQLRVLAHGIYPAALDHEGLVGALESASYRTQVPVVVNAPDDLSRWPREVEAALYFCCWELLQGLRRHADAGTELRLDLDERRDIGSFAISAPLRSSQRDEGTALYLQDRIGAVGGEVTVETTEGGIIAAGWVTVS